MATAQTIIDAVKYDFNDFGEQEYDNTMLIHYLNRMIVLLDRALIGQNSDQTLTEGSVTLLISTNSIAAPIRAGNIREIWDENEVILAKLSAREIYERRMHRQGNTAMPKFWAHIQENIEFEVTADAEYDFTVYYDMLSAPITALTNDMPYDSLYDGYLREALVMVAKGKKDQQFAQADSAYFQMFKDVVWQDMINRNFVPRMRLDF